MSCLPIFLLGPLMVFSIAKLLDCLMQIMALIFSMQMLKIWWINLLNRIFHTTCWRNRFKCLVIILNTIFCPNTGKRWELKCYISAHWFDSPYLLLGCDILIMFYSGYVLIWYGGLVVLFTETGLILAGGAQTSSGPRHWGLHMILIV